MSRFESSPEHLVELTNTESAKHLGKQALLMATWSATCFLSIATLTFKRSRVHNISSIDAFTRRVAPGFKHQTKNAKALLEFKSLVNLSLDSRANQLEKVVAIRKWVRQQQSDREDVWRLPHKNGSEDPKTLLIEQRQGMPGACRRFSYILLGALLSIGVDSRLVHIAAGFHSSTMNHTMVEAWIDDLKKWVLIDPTFDTLLFVDGSPGSLMDVYLASKTPGRKGIVFERNNSKQIPSPDWQTYAVNLEHMFVSQTNAVFDGYRVGLLCQKPITFLHFVDKTSRPYPERKKLLALTCGTVLACASFGAVMRMFCLRLRYKCRARGSQSYSRKITYN